MSDYTPEDTIFVQIASYRDPELQWTLKDLFEKAKRPENIFVGICHQYDMKGDEDKHLFEIPFSHPKQLRIDEVDYRESQGCCWARNRVQKLWKGEKWTLMIDSHMRFEKYWDEILVINLKKQINKNNNKLLLTAYLPGYEYIDNKNIKYFTNLGSIKLLFDSEFIRCNGANNIKNFSNIAGFSAHFAFTTSDFIKEIKYDPYLFFLGEEPTVAARLFTNGWNILCFNDIIMYHLYNNREKKQKRQININNKNNNMSKLRQHEIFNIKKIDNEDALMDIKEYGLGNKRTLRDYERFSGVDFRRKITREHTKQGIFEEWQEVAKISNVKNVFNNIRNYYAQNSCLFFYR